MCAFVFPNNILIFYKDAASGDPHLHLSKPHAPKNNQEVAVGPKSHLSLIEEMIVAATAQRHDVVVVMQPAIREACFVFHVAGLRVKGVAPHAPTHQMAL